MLFEINEMEWKMTFNHVFDGSLIHALEQNQKIV